jgi:hypothetical protein
MQDRLDEQTENALQLQKIIDVSFCAYVFLVPPYYDIY